MSDILSQKWPQVDYLEFDKVEIFHSRPISLPETIHFFNSRPNGPAIWQGFPVLRIFKSKVAAG